MLIPKKGLVYDHVYMYRQFGSWNSWSILVERIDIETKLKV